MRPFLVVVIAAGLGACLLLGWAVAYYYDRKSRQEDRDSDT